MSEWLRADVMLIILVLAAVTMSLRLGGFLLMSYVTVTPRVRRTLDALPGCVIVSAVAPVALQGGIVATAAILSALLAMYLSRSDFLAMFAGVGIAALLRTFGLDG